MEQNQIALVPQGGVVATLDSMAVPFEAILKRKHMLQEIMTHIMKDNVHFGKIPGCGDKPTLLKPGAEALSSTFQIAPEYIITKTELGNGHREYEIVCKLYALNGAFVGSGVGSATTMEGKYRFRVGGGEITAVPVPQAYWNTRKADPKKAAKVLADAAKAAGVEGESFGTKKDDAGMWMLTTKSAEARVEHDNPADYYNTVLKMAKKRAFVDAILTTTGASDIFTQDIEDMPEVIPGVAKAAQGQPMQQGGFQAPSGMDQMPGQDGGYGPDPINVEVFTKAVSMMSLEDLKAEWEDEDFQLRYGVSDKKAIKEAFDARIAELTKKAA
jgi:hypothetical protein